MMVALFCLAWDTKNERTVTVTADMEQSACEELINSAGGCVCTCRALLADGEYVAFVDVKCLNSGRLSVKVFSQTGKPVKTGYRR